MLAGHYAPALQLKRYAPDVPLWALCVGVQAVDIGFMLLSLVGLEGGKVDVVNAPHFTVLHGVWTHSLTMTLVYGAACVVVGLASGHRRVGWIAALAVTSHWLGDLVVHVPDLPVGLTDTPSLGLGLWRTPLAATLLECGLLAITAGRYRLLAGVLIFLQVLSDWVLPRETNLQLLAVEALLLYGGVAVGAWWDERRRRAD